MRVWLLSQFHDFHIALLDDVQVDFWSKDDVMVSPSRQESFQRQLNEMDVAWEISIDNVQTVVQEEKESLQGESRSLSRDKFHSYQEMKDYLQELAKLYSNTVSVGSIGSSYEGRDLPILKISSGGDDTRPIILIDAGIHAREWIAPAMALYIIQQLVENPSNADLIANVDWHVIPLLNPDGYEYSRKSSRLWRKTRSKTKRKGCFGVDGNRNFDIHWNGIGGSTDPCSETYVGPRPFSEPETAALRDYVMKQLTKSGSRIKLYLTFHSYASGILYPWGYTWSQAPNANTMKALAQEANLAQKRAGGHDFTVGQTARVFYAAAGGSDDWVASAGRVPLVYTVEMPRGGNWGFDLPPSAINRTVSAFWPAVRVMGRHVQRS
ncbi:hypothetical protein R5R35_000243 [Gryllus longicercus]|uniref:Peptidase M14 domain-containing protein n=1 Tax=Gryllus longicercus TaxID=2509291 RepID=A0AAN9Z939_9ORTH